MQWYMKAPLPNGEFQLVSYSRSVISSITGHMEKIFRHIEVVTSSVNRMVWCAGKTAAIQRFLSKFLLVLTFLLPGSIVSQLIEEVMTSTN